MAFICLMFYFTNKIAAKWFTKLLFQDNNFNTYICAINRIQK